MMKELLKEELLMGNNAEWLQFISDLEDLACFLRSKEMESNAELVDKAIKLLIDWNPERNESIKRCCK